MAAFTQVPVRPFSLKFKLNGRTGTWVNRSEEHTSELQSLAYLVCRLLPGKIKISSADDMFELQSLTFLVCSLLPVYYKPCLQRSDQAKLRRVLPPRIFIAVCRSELCTDPR